MARMTVDKAVALVRYYYDQAQASNKIFKGFIKNPIAWALYQVWKMADKAGGR